MFFSLPCLCVYMFVYLCVLCIRILCMFPCLFWHVCVLVLLMCVCVCVCVWECVCVCVCVCVCMGVCLLSCAMCKCASMSLCVCRECCNQRHLCRNEWKLIKMVGRKVGPLCQEERRRCNSWFESLSHTHCSADAHNAAYEWGRKGLIWIPAVRPIQLKWFQTRQPPLGWHFAPRPEKWGTPQWSDVLITYEDRPVFREVDHFIKMLNACHAWVCTPSTGPWQAP